MTNNCNSTKQLLLKSNEILQIVQIKLAALFLKYVERSYLIEFILVDVFSFPQYMSGPLHNPFFHAKSRKHRLTFIGWRATMINSTICTGKSLSEALLFAEHGENMLWTKIVLNVRNNFCTQHVLPRFELGIFMYWTCNSMNNVSSYWCKNKSFWQRFTCTKYIELLKVR